MNKLRIVIPLLVVGLSACGQSEDSEPSVSSAGPGSAGTASSGQALASPWYSAAQVTEGERVFKDNCAQCHGAQAEGDSDWRRADSEGKYPPPPLNGSGHGWHHPLRILFTVIKNGSPGGQGNMPAWGDSLSDEEILSSIAWFQSNWPEEIYAAWRRRDQQARSKTQ